MSIVKKTRRVNSEELRNLGFSEDLVREAVLREQRGLLAIEPPADLVERTIQACADLFSEQDKSVAASTEMSLESANYFSRVCQFMPAAVGVRDISLAFQAAAAAAQCQVLGEWPGRLADSLGFAISERKSPLVVLENHNLTSPAWWEDNEEFQKIHMACDRLNDFVISTGIERSVRLVVLRPSIFDYRSEEIDAIGDLMREATSDIWWVPVSRAPQYAHQDVVVIGSEKVMRLRMKPESPPDAFRAIEYSEDIKLATLLRREINKEISSFGTPIKIHGRLQPGFAQAIHQPNGIKLALESVIEERSLAKACDW